MKHARYLALLILIFCLGSLFADRIWDASASRKYNYPLSMPKYHETKADSATGFDVQKYEITLTITQNPNHIQGNVLATVVAEEYLPSISYELVGLTVSQVLVNGSVSTYTHSNGVLTIPVNANANETFQTQVFYGGTPQLSGNAYNIGMYFQANSIFTISDPDAGRFWWPCYDHPWDKAIVDLIITMRSDWKVAANGLRESIVDNGNGTSTTTWRGYHPMTTYLVCITAGPYVEINQTAMDGDLPIQNFVTQNQYNNALSDLAPLPEMVDFYSNLFGPYPFEKYGNATVSMSTFAAMEHQTMTTLGNFIINGNGTHELTIAHELVHQWYGNAVSFLDFKDVWLSEGFATYGEHLWVDHVEGWDAACAYVLSSYHQYYTNWENSYGPAVIYNPAFLNYFSPPSYEKAASVLHMLRLKMGDAQFFQLLQEWFSTYRDGNVVTSEFQAMAESISGLDLEQFFQQWIYGSGIPSVDYRIMHKPETDELKVFAICSSPTTTGFVVDFPILLTGSAGSDSLLVMASMDGNVNYYPGIQAFEEVSGNHNNWTLLRGLVEERPVLATATALDAEVRLFWYAWPEAINYKVYYKLETSSEWSLAHSEALSETHFSVQNLQNGQSYAFRIVAIDYEGYHSLPSNSLLATPQHFSFHLPLLVVDETRDGNGNAISPDDAMVDAFYHAALSPYEYVQWDVASQGLPSVTDLAQYRTVLWHADDFSQNLAFEVEEALHSYFLASGNLIFSGWRSAGTFSDQFWQSLSGHNAAIYYDNSACLIGLTSDTYPPLNVDQSKLAAPWNGMLPMINTFETPLPALYYANMPDGFNGTGRQAALQIADHSYFFGFPLYFMEAEGVRDLMQMLMQHINTSSDDPLIPAIGMTLAAHPNPFNPSTKIHFDVPNAGKTTLKLYNMKGQLLKVLADEELKQGKHTLNLELETQASGIYILSLENGGKRMQKRITLMK